MHDVASLSLQPPYAPVVIEDVLLAFPASVRHLMPEYDQVTPKPKWEELANDWFCDGVDDISLLPSKLLAVDFDSNPEVAWRHLKAIMGSYEPKHQHKIQAVGFLLGTWFRWAKWTTSSGVQKEVGNQGLPPM